MSRSGYSYDYDHVNLYRNAVDRSIAGRRGQTFLRRLLAALDALPRPRLIAGLLRENDDVCTLGSLIPVETIAAKPSLNDEDLDAERLTGLLDAAPSLLREIAYLNDEEGPSRETPEARFVRIRAWIVSQLREEPSCSKPS